MGPAPAAPSPAAPAVLSLLILSHMPTVAAPLALAHAVCVLAAAGLLTRVVPVFTALGPATAALAFVVRALYAVGLGRPARAVRFRADA